MDFDDNELANEKLLNMYQQNINQAEFKRYVVEIHNSYIDLFDSLTQEERNNIINDMISAYSDNMQEKLFWKGVWRISLKVLLILFVLLVVVPFFLILFNRSIEFTSSTNKQMQQNFEVLYQKKAR